MFRKGLKAGFVDPIWSNRNSERKNLKEERSRRAFPVLVDVQPPRHPPGSHSKQSGMFTIGSTEQDSLNKNDQIVIKGASVVGQMFSVDVVAAILGKELREVGRAGLDNSMNVLVEQKLVEVMGEPSKGKFRFKNASTQEIVYSLLLHSRRKNFHRKVAEYYEHQWGQQGGGQIPTDGHRPLPRTPRCRFVKGHRTAAWASGQDKEGQVPQKHRKATLHYPSQRPTPQSTPGRR